MKKAPATPQPLKFHGRPLRVQYGGNYLRVCEAAGIAEPPTMVSLGETTGYSYNHVNRIFNGQGRPSAACLDAMAAALGVTPRKLLAAMERELPDRSRE